MSWSLSASGHADNPDDEKALAAALGQSLAQAGATVSYASFSGSGFSGDPRDLAAPAPVPDPGAGPAEGNGL